MVDDQCAKTLPLRWVFLKSFYSKALYRSVAKHWRSKAFQYLVVLCMILMVPIAIRFVINLDAYKYHYMKPVIKQLPQKMEFHNGTMSLQPDGIYHIKLPPLNKTYAILDPHNQIKDDLRALPASVIFKKHGVIYEYQSNIYHASYFMEGGSTITPHNFWHKMRRFTFWLNVIEFVFLYVFGGLLLYLAYLIYSFFLTSFTSIFSGLLDYRIPILTNWQITIVASTLPSSLAALLFLFNWLFLPTIALALVIQFIFLLIITIVIRPIFTQRWRQGQTVC